MSNKSNSIFASKYLIMRLFSHSDDDTNDNDISLIKLSRSLDLSPTGYINAICLPESDDGEKTYQAGKSCVAAGWGTLSKNVVTP